MYYFKAITLRALARMVGIVGSVLARVRSLRPVLSRRRPIGDAGLPPPNTGRTIDSFLFLSFVLFVAQFVWLASEPTVCDYLERVVPGTVPVATNGRVTHVALEFFRVPERFVFPTAIAARFRCSRFNRPLDHDDFPSLSARVLQRLGEPTERERAGDSTTSTLDDPLRRRIVELPREYHLQI